VLHGCAFIKRGNMNNKKELYEALGGRLRQFRKEKGLSQAELASLCNLKRAMVSRMETGDSKPNIEMLFILNGNHSLSLNWLFTGKGGMLNTDDVKLDCENKDVEKMVREMLKNRALMHSVLGYYLQKRMELTMIENGLFKEEWQK
jgi:transcriptional regulator with XRE-family HTH domain